MYLSRYTTDRMFLQFNIATFDETHTICWLRPDYVLQLVNIPIGLILLSNLTVLISAVATAYRSATFRWNHEPESLIQGALIFLWDIAARNTATLVKLTAAARNCVTLCCILGFGFLVGFYFLFQTLHNCELEVGFIPCHVSSMIEPYTFTIVNGLAGSIL